MSEEIAPGRQPRRVEAMRHSPDTYSLALRLRKTGLTVSWARADVLRLCSGFVSTKRHQR